MGPRMAETVNTNVTSNGSENLERMVDVISAFVANNKLSTTELVALIADVNKAFVDIAKGPSASTTAKPQPAVPVRKSVTAEYIICLEDGLKFRSLKRHLRTKYNMSPEEYRKKWDLPSDYPMVSHNYSAARSALAKKAGLGQARQLAEKRTAGKKASLRKASANAK